MKSIHDTQTVSDKKDAQWADDIAEFESLYKRARVLGRLVIDATVNNDRVLHDKLVKSAIQMDKQMKLIMSCWPNKDWSKYND